MSILTPQQIRQLAYNAGFRGADLEMAVAIALAESSGNPLAYNPETAAGTKPGSGSRGLWQIYGTAHPEYNNDTAFDPVKNAEAAYKVFVEAGRRFTPWSTYNNGSAGNIAKNLPGGTAETKNTDIGVSATGNSSGISLPGNPLAPTIETINKISAVFSDPVKTNKIRADIGFIVVGGTLFVLGLFLFFYSAGKDVVSSQAGSVINSALKG